MCEMLALSAGQGLISQKQSRQKKKSKTNGQNASVMTVSFITSFVMPLVQLINQYIIN